MTISHTWVEDLNMQVIRRAYLQSHGESVRNIRHAFQGKETLYNQRGSTGQDRV
ncbi:hypothetical protein CABS01_04139 [Colletotrichum abscissum]|uniref:Uncharacterized protein n=2 Tax=Colletotrichum acutatum species complex TaxID=2707335 RepID=A0A9P9X9E6_9PEZI|nr:uncharacterized protein CLUP02_05905 [Colletotrichum lupini]XP_060390355.1 uncharacterized protein CABS01_04139 [Colletotrichum abscissum]KAI3542688.1 hypothetical protein CABS02_10308 [Colletotrichum abscissum]KAK1473477.1 hypothetical protein CABS01_04139 [Colletotrichum abscissum]UQC80422.1 hypothetical protein CLUP02_05905 [Colletotrichum lupini]